MGILVDGTWYADEDAGLAAATGPVPQDTTFRDWVTADGSSGWPAEAGRYHLYVSLNCPWACRTLIARRLKGLDDVISVDVVYPHNGPDGWTFATNFSGATGDTVNGKSYLREIYQAAREGYSGRVTVPVLWDRKTATIVNNESAEIMRMLNSAFDAYAKTDVDLYPEALRAEIDAINDVVFRDVNIGVYAAGFADNQEDYEAAFDALFNTLDDLEERLSHQRYLVGDRLTEADWRLFTTLVRFDAAYHGVFKCNKHRLIDYPNLWAFTRDLYAIPGVAETVDLDHIKRGYYGMDYLNPKEIVAKGPHIDFTEPHGRAQMA